MSRVIRHIFCNVCWLWQFDSRDQICHSWHNHYTYPLSGHSAHSWVHVQNHVLPISLECYASCLNNVTNHLANMYILSIMSGKCEEWLMLLHILNSTHKRHKYSYLYAHYLSLPLSNTHIHTHYKACKKNWQNQSWKQTLIRISYTELNSLPATECKTQC